MKKTPHEIPEEVLAALKKLGITHNPETDGFVFQMGKGVKVELPDVMLSRIRRAFNITKATTRTQREFEPVNIIETKDFSAIVVQDPRTGNNSLKMTAPVWYQHQLNKLRPKEKVSLYVSSRRPKRTMAQNRYYWGVYLPLIAAETGEHDLERLHRYFAGKFLTSEIVEVFGQKVRMVKSTTELSKSDFSEYIMNIEADTGVAAPPTENYLYG